MMIIGSRAMISRSAAGCARNGTDFRVRARLEKLNLDFLSTLVTRPQAFSKLNIRAPQLSVYFVSPNPPSVPMVPSISNVPSNPCCRRHVHCQCVTSIAQTPDMSSHDEPPISALPSMPTITIPAPAAVTPSVVPTSALRPQLVQGMAQLGLSQPRSRQPPSQPRRSEGCGRHGYYFSSTYHPRL
jgi:hypothetical protein